MTGFKSYSTKKSKKADVLYVCGMLHMYVLRVLHLVLFMECVIVHLVSTSCTQPVPLEHQGPGKNVKVCTMHCDVCIQTLYCIYIRRCEISPG